VVASASADGTVKLWNTRTAKILLDIRNQDQTGAVYSLAFNADGKLLATTGQAESVHVWDTESGRKSSTMVGYVNDAVSVAFLPEGRRIVSAGWGKAVRIWDLRTGNPLHTLSGHDWMVHCVACSPDGRHVASASADRTVRLWDADTGKEVVSPALQHNA